MGAEQVAGIEVGVGVRPGATIEKKARALPEQRIQPLQFSPPLPRGDEQKGLPEHLIGGGSVGKSQ